MALDIDQSLLAISPDGKTLAWIGGEVEPQRRIYTRAIDELEVRPIAGTEGAMTKGLLLFSPDGRQPEIYIQEIVPDRMGSGLKRKISPDGGIEPVWARDGRELFYRSVDGTEPLSASIRT